MTLLEKLANITDEFGSLTKSGENPAFKYKYVKGEDSMKQFRVLEVKHKIKVIPAVQPNSLVITPKKDTGFVTTFIMDYNIYDLESDAKLTVSIPTQGYDTTDKATFKGMTGGFKYFLLQTFSYSSDDPEAAEEEIPFEIPAKTSFKNTAPAKTDSRVSTFTTGQNQTGPVQPVGFKPKIVGTEVATTSSNTTSKFSDMLPKTGASVSFKESGLSSAFKPTESK